MVISMPFSLSARRVTSNSSFRRRLLSNSRQTALLFPGQGAQFVGMSKLTVDDSSRCPDVEKKVNVLYEEASSLLGYDLHKLCLNGPESEVNSTKVAQVAIFVNSMAALEKLRILNPWSVENCALTMGLSLGEFSALCFAGAFSFEDGVRLTKARGEAMQSVSDQRQGGMVAVVGLVEERVEFLCEKVKLAAKIDEKTPILMISSYLSNNNFVVSGDLMLCNEFIKAVKVMEEVKVARMLAVSGAFHTPLMHPAQNALISQLNEVHLTPKSMNCPVLSNVTGDTSYDISSSIEDIKEGLLKQLVQPIRWDKSMEVLLSKQFDIVEVGPGTVCSGIIKMKNRRAKVKCLGL